MSSQRPMSPARNSCSAVVIAMRETDCTPYQIRRNPVSRANRANVARKEVAYWILWLLPIVAIPSCSSTRIQTSAPGSWIDLTASRASSSRASDVEV